MNNKTKRVFLLAVSIMAINHGHSTECSSVDLRTGPNNPFQELNIESQGNHGTCYAYAGATMANYSMMQNQGNAVANISPLELAALANHPSNNGTLDSGNSGTALRALANQGTYCPREHLTSWLNQHIGPGSEAIMISILQGSLSPENRRNFMNQVRRFRANYDSVLANAPDRIPESARSGTSLGRSAIRRELLVQAEGRRLLEEMMPDCVHCGPRAPLADILEHFEFMDSMVRWMVNHEDANEKDIFGQIIEIACQYQRVPLPADFSIRNIRNLEDAPFVARLDRILEAPGANPPGLSMCAQVLDHPDYDGVEMNRGVRVYSNSDECRSHAIVVIARRNHPTRGCQYLIRNSWGSFPGTNYHASYQFEDGGVWMSSEQIAHSAVEIISVR
jgi:hypothetical protein